MKKRNLTADGVRELGLNPEVRQPYKIDGIFKIDGVEIVPLYNVNFNEREEKYYIDSVNEFIKIDNEYLKPYKGYSDKTYSFYFPVDADYNQTEYAPLPSPKKIGIPTIKKLREWKDYLIIERENINKKRAEIDAKIEAFLKEIEKLQYCRIDDAGTYKYKFSGVYVRNGIKYTYLIDERTGYISENICIHYKVSAGINSFINLSTNNYK